MLLQEPPSPPEPVPLGMAAHSVPPLRGIPSPGKPKEPHQQAAAASTSQAVAPGPAEAEAGVREVDPTEAARAAAAASAAAAAAVLKGPTAEDMQRAAELLPETSRSQPPGSAGFGVGAGSVGSHRHASSMYGQPQQVGQGTMAPGMQGMHPQQYHGMQGGPNPMMMHGMNPVMMQQMQQVSSMPATHGMPSYNGYNAMRTPSPQPHAHRRVHSSAASVKSNTSRRSSKRMTRQESAQQAMEQTIAMQHKAMVEAQARMHAQAQAQMQRMQSWQAQGMQYQGGPMGTQQSPMMQQGHPGMQQSPMMQPGHQGMQQSPMMQHGQMQPGQMQQGWGAWPGSNNRTLGPMSGGGASQQSARGTVRCTVCVSLGSHAEQDSLILQQGLINGNKLTCCTMKHFRPLQSRAHVH
jgi:hypothetical protein